ncbi:hypothetical protein [Prosthecomicrobium pneumaticum]|uniref:Uncharacterized protein n=1 Tax=Prosthecomicrobium pneumaticum TaxID=81895 RepID=A0A7W9CTI5_9HYPH|nr:hypothetical protein [Prosthecomicrobium pneumaticum]MBB5751278.1 hypothetical protein [Prosthecomicrobium pneumaticum]
MAEPIETRLAAFRAALAAGGPPEGATPALAALWHLERGDWDAAHACIQDEADADSAWVHAHLHRVEGDRGNARYWYGRAGRPSQDGPLDAERVAILTALLGR